MNAHQCIIGFGTLNRSRTVGDRETLWGWEPSIAEDRSAFMMSWSLQRRGSSDCVHCRQDLTS